MPNLLQKTTLIIGKLCFVMSAVSGIFLYLKVDELGMGHPLSASFLAAIFFFGFVGILLTIIGSANVPNLRFSSIGGIDNPLPGEQKKPVQEES